MAPAKWFRLAEYWWTKQGSNYIRCSKEADPCLLYNSTVYILQSPLKLCVVQHL